MSESIILVLGHKNDEDGLLSDIAKQRCDKGFEVFQSSPQAIMCTGGFGEKFNTTKHSHGFHLRQYLQTLGIPGQRFLPDRLSRNTYEDGKLTSEYLAEHPVQHIHLVTSDFHMKRAFLWMKRFMPTQNIVCWPAHTQAESVYLNQLKQHEKQAIKQFYSDFPDFPTIDQFADWHKTGRQKL